MDLYAKARTLGIQTEYIDGSGHLRVTTPEALSAILEALPPQAPRRIVADPVVISAGRTAPTQLAKAARLPVQWKITSGARLLAQGEAQDRTVAWPPGLPPGVHRLQVSDASGASEELPLLVVPDKAFGGEFDRNPDGSITGVDRIDGVVTGETNQYYKDFARAMREIDYRGYTSYELCHQLPLVNGETVEIEFAHKNARLAAEFMREIIRGEYAKKTVTTTAPGLVGVA